MMTLPVRFKLLSSIGFILLVVMSTSTYIHIQEMKTDYVETINWRSEALAQGLITDFLSRLQFGIYTDDDIRNMMGALSLQCIQLYEANQGKYITHVAVIDPAGTIMAHNDSAFWDTPLDSPVVREEFHRQILTTVLDRETYHTLVPIVLEQEGESRYLGAVDIGASESFVEQRVRQLLWQSVIVLAGFVVLALAILAVWLNVLIIKPIGQLIRASSAIANGNLEYTLSITRRDEFGTLAHSFASMRDAIRDKMAALKTVNAELDRRIEDRTAEVQRLEQLITQMMAAAERLGQSSDDMIRISTTMAAGAEQAAQQVQVVSTNSQQISEGVHTVSTTTEEVAANIREISQNIHEITGIINQAAKTADAANTIITDLERHSEDIGAITQVITSITAQTNLLALNATIEAARAGESGRGFAVVANEVKELAKETALSAEDITRKIATIQSSSQEANAAMTDVAEITHRVSELADAIASAITQQSQVTDEGSRSLIDAARGSAEISRAITEIATSTSDASEQAVNVHQQAEELASLADQLRQLVETFRDGES